jgi:hypothetical protein
MHKNPMAIVTGPKSIGANAFLFTGDLLGYTRLQVTPSVEAVSALHRERQHSPPYPAEYQLYR